MAGTLPEEQVDDFHRHDHAQGGGKEQAPDKPIQGNNDNDTDPPENGANVAAACRLMEVRPQPGQAVIRGCFL